MSERAAQRQQFLGKKFHTLLPLPTDASRRQYFRYEGGLLMDALHPEENIQQFMRVATYLAGLEFSAPRLFTHNLELGFLALEDFGPSTYTQLLEQGQNPVPLYELAIDTLIALHRKATACPEFIAPYDSETLLREADLFIEWHMPALLGEAMTLADRQSWLDVWSAAFDKVDGVPQSLVLRDYHVDNLVYLKGRSSIQACGLLDFQDALWGPAVYDVVSLLEDARLDVDASLAQHCWQRYLAAFPDTDSQKIRQAGCVLSAGRHVKIMGIFTRLAVRDGKSGYLSHLSRVWRHLQTCLQHPALQEVQKWFEEWKSIINTGIFYSPLNIR